MPIRILVVDDNRDTLRTYIKAILQRVKPQEWTRGLPTLDYSQIEVEDADTISLAIEKMSMKSFEIIIVDLKILGLSGDEMGGLELISESLKLDPLRPIIAITGYGNIELTKKIFKQGVFDFIEKSETAIDELIDSVIRAVKYRIEQATL
jgi:DNA-binding NtrC family response regulator